MIYRFGFAWISDSLKTDNFLFVSFFKNGELMISVEKNYVMKVTIIIVVGIVVIVVVIADSNDKFYLNE